VEKDRVKLASEALRGVGLAGRTGDALGPLPPSFDPEVRIESDPAAARPARGDHTRAAIDEYKPSRETLTAIEDQSRRDRALDRQWERGSKHHDRYVEDLLKERPDLVAAIKAPDPALVAGDQGESARSRDWRTAPKTASPELLGELAGVGPGLAERIVATREQAPFESSTGLDKWVPGIGDKTLQDLRPYLRFPSDPASNPAGADRACGDLLNIRPPCLPGTTGAVSDGYSAQDAAREILAGLPRLSLSQPAPLPGLSSRDLPMELVKPPVALEEARREISDHLRHAISAGPGPSSALGRDVGDPERDRTDRSGLFSNDFTPARSVLSELVPPVESARRADLNGLLSGRVTPARSVLSELAPPVESAQRAGGGIGDQVSVDLAAAAKDLREAAREFRQGAGPGAAAGQPGPRGGGLQTPLPGIPPALPGRM